MANNNEASNVPNNLPITDNCDDQPNCLSGSQTPPDSAPTVDLIDTASLPSPAPVSKAQVVDLAALPAKAEAKANGAGKPIPLYTIINFEIAAQKRDESADSPYLEFWLKNDYFIHKGENPLPAKLLPKSCKP